MAKPTFTKRSIELKEKAFKLQARIKSNEARYDALPLCARLFDKRAKRIKNEIQNKKLALFMLTSMMLAASKQERKKPQ